MSQSKDVTGSESFFVPSPNLTPFGSMIEPKQQSQIATPTSRWKKDIFGRFSTNLRVNYVFKRWSKSFWTQWKAFNGAKRSSQSTLKLFPSQAHQLCFLLNISYLIYRKIKSSDIWKLYFLVWFLKMCSFPWEIYLFYFGSHCISKCF